MADETIGTLKFGTAGLANPTPPWAKTVIWVVAILAFAIAFWVAGTSYLDDSQKKEVLLITVIVDKIIFFLCKSFGIEAPSIG